VTHPDLFGLDSNRSEKTSKSKSLSDLEEDLDLLLKIKDVGAIACWGPPFLTPTRTPMKSTGRAVLHLHPVWQNQPELHRLKCVDPFSDGSKDSTALQTV
jgi:hypothetical protein